jgi:hypothetical protein
MHSSIGDMKPLLTERYGPHDRPVEAVESSRPRALTTSCAKASEADLTEIQGDVTKDKICNSVVRYIGGRKRS